MKKAKIILLGIFFLTIAAGTFALNVFRNLRKAYTFTGGSTWISTTVGTQVYSTTVPFCLPLSIGPSAAYISNVGDLATVYTTTFTITTYTTTTNPGGPTVSTTKFATICNTLMPIQTLITTIQ